MPVQTKTILNSCIILRSPTLSAPPPPPAPCGPLLSSQIVFCWLQLFILFLVHAYGSRLWRPGDGSRQQGPVSPSEHPYQAPAGTPKLYMDGPWRLQWPCLIPWALVQAAHSVAWLRNASSTAPLPTAPCPACCCCCWLACCWCCCCCCCLWCPAGPGSASH